MDVISWRSVLVRLGLFVLVFAATSTVAILPLATIFSVWAEANPVPARLYGDVAAALAIVSTTWVMTSFVDKRAFQTIGFDAKGLVPDVLVGLLLGIGWIGTSVLILIVAGWASPLALSEISIAPLAIATVSVLFNVVTQQLLVCGYILQSLRLKVGMPIAILLAALLFSALHAAAFKGAWLPPINVFTAGLVFCLGYAVSGNLWLPIAIHFSWNLLLGPVLGLTVSGTDQLGLGWQAFEISGPEFFTGGAFGIEGGFIVTLTTVGLVMILLLLTARKGIAEEDRVSRIT